MYCVDDIDNIYLPYMICAVDDVYAVPQMTFWIFARTASDSTVTFPLYLPTSVPYEKVIGHYMLRTFTCILLKMGHACVMLYLNIDVTFSHFAWNFDLFSRICIILFTFCIMNIIYWCDTMNM